MKKKILQVFKRGLLKKTRGLIQISMAWGKLRNETRHLELFSNKIGEED
jgi:hypothetical protein